MSLYSSLNYVISCSSGLHEFVFMIAECEYLRVIRICELSAFASYPLVNIQQIILVLLLNMSLYSSLNYVISCSSALHVFVFMIAECEFELLICRT